MVRACAFVAGVFLLESGTDRFIDHTAIVARRLRISETIIVLFTVGAEWEEVSMHSVIDQIDTDLTSWRW